ncbi:hypothetical protein Tco_1307520 [Tanacetum coccineum]
MASSNTTTLKDISKSSCDIKSKMSGLAVEAVKPSTKPNNEYGVSDDALRFLASVFKTGESSQQDKDEFDESFLIDWLKLNVGDHQECQKVLNGVKEKVQKADALMNEIRAMGHDLTNDYVVDLIFLSED